MKERPETMDGEPNAANLYRDDFKESGKHFTKEGYEILNALLWRMNDGDGDAANELAAMVIPWIERSIQKIEEEMPPACLPTEEEKHDLINEAWYSVLEKPMSLWSDFNQHFYWTLRERYESRKLLYDKEQEYGHFDSYKNRPANVSTHSLKKITFVEKDEVTEAEVAAGISDMLESLTARKKDILLRMIIEEETHEEIAKTWNVSRSMSNIDFHKALAEIRESTDLPEIIELWLQERGLREER